MILQAQLIEPLVLGGMKINVSGQIDLQEFLR